jgi:hypothetical protein
MERLSVFLQGFMRPVSAMRTRKSLLDTMTQIARSISSKTPGSSAPRQALTFYH